MMAIVFLLVGAVLATLCQHPETNPFAYMWFEKTFPSSIARLMLLLVPPLNLIKVCMPSAESCRDIP